MTAIHILVVDDDNAFRETLLKTLKNQGYRVTGISNPDSLAATIVVQRPDVVLLDMMFNTGVNGLDVCRNLRTWASIPVVILSVIEDETIKVAALDAGADDYLTKPFGINELLARIRAVQRRMGPKMGTIAPLLVGGDLIVDFDNRVVKVRDQLIHLTRKEFALLRYLADAQGRLVTYEQLLTTIWKDEKSFERSKVRALVMQVRNKLGEDLSNPTYILTEAGVGYKLNVEPIADVEKEKQA